MEKPTIGIKVADGSYYPILEEDSTSRKRLVLTTVNDNQESVQIDLYKGEGPEMTDAAYVGSLLIENIVQGPKESSEIELKIGFDKDGNLNAEAGDPVSGQVESLSISMESLNEAQMYDIPEFSLDGDSEELNISEEVSESDFDEDLSLDDGFEDIQELNPEDDSDDLDISEIDLDEDLSLDGVFEDTEDAGPDDNSDDIDISEMDLDEDLSLDGVFEDIEDSAPEDNSDDIDIPEMDLDEDFSLDDSFEDTEDLNTEDESGDDFSFDDLDSDVIDESLDDQDDESMDEMEEDDYTPGFPPEFENESTQSERKRANPLLVALLVIIAIAVIAGISYLLFHSLQGENAPNLEAKSGTVEEPASVVADTPSVPVPEDQVVKSATDDKSAINSNEEPQVDETATAQPPPPEIQNRRVQDTTGVWYRVRWGDTLWGISYSFYDSPSEYNQIVQENSIKNPDIIFAETELFIPTR